jgi:hypothetical protein
MVRIESRVLLTWWFPIYFDKTWYSSISSRQVKIVVYECEIFQDKLLFCTLFTNLFTNCYGVKLIRLIRRIMQVEQIYRQRNLRNIQDKT